MAAGVKCTNSSIDFYKVHHQPQAPVQGEGISSLLVHLMYQALDKPPRQLCAVLWPIVWAVFCDLNHRCSTWMLPGLRVEDGIWLCGWFASHKLEGHGLTLTPVMCRASHPPIPSSYKCFTLHSHALNLTSKGSTSQPPLGMHRGPLS